jgi:putative drug exporter of the RND superfamily
VLIPLISIAVATTVLPIILSMFGQRLDGRTRAQTTAPAARGRAGRPRSSIAAGSPPRRPSPCSRRWRLRQPRFGLGATNGEPNTVNQRADARQALNRLERSAIGSGVLTPTEILTHRGSPARIAERVQRVAGGGQRASARAAATWRHGDTAVLDAVARTDAGAAVDGRATAAHGGGCDVRVGGIVARHDDLICAPYDSFPPMIASIAALTLVLLAGALRR